MKNYAKEINDSLLSFENNKPYHLHNIDWICNRIDWCWKWRKITRVEMEEFVDRVCNIMENK